MMDDRGITSNENSSITARSIIISLVLVAINAYWVVITSELWYIVYNTVSPFANAVFSIVPLILVNALSKKVFKRDLLSSAEMLIIYIAVTMVTTVIGHTTMTVLMGALSHPYWYATPENEWQQLFWPHIPSWFTVSNVSVLRGYFEGDSSFFIWEHVRAWAVPILVWSGFIFVAVFAMLCINVILRKQWVEREKLSYPLIQLPLAMTHRRAWFFSSRMMWIGFGIAAVVRIINGFSSLYPSIPSIPQQVEIGRYITDRPWNAIGYTLVSFRLSIIGLVYFMPLDLSLSCWFFFWLAKAERVMAEAMGWNNLHLDERAAGAWIGVGVIAIWLSRKYLVDVVRQIFTRQSSLNETTEPMSYRTAFILLIFCLVFLFGFCYQAGMTLWAIVVFYSLFFIMGLAITRVRAELGPPYHEVIFVNPRQVITEAFGSKLLGGGNLMVMSFLYFFNRCNRSHSMPNQLESLKIAERSGMKGSRLIWAMTLAVGIGTVVAFVSYLQVLYKYGAVARCRGWIGQCGWESFNPLQSWMQYSTDPNWSSIGFMIGGFGFVMLLMFLRKIFFWWPLHPSGYVLAGASWGGMIYFWFPVLLTWAIKSLVLRHGGLGTYRKTAPMFLGLVLGDYILWFLWSIISVALNIPISAAY
jgi:hypothetical protein